MALEELEGVHANPFLKIDPRYARIVDELLAVLRPYRELIPDGARESLKQEIRKALAGVPPFYIPSYRTYVPVETTEWLCVEDNGEPVAIRMIGDRHIVIARDDNTFEVEVSEDKGGSRTRVTRDDAGWHCSAHAKASGRQPCSEIKLVLDMTDGGKPVTARVVVMERSEGPPR